MQRDESEKPMSFHELTESALKIKYMLDDPNIGAWPEEGGEDILKDALDGLNIQLYEKIRSCGYVYRNNYQEAAILRGKAQVFLDEGKRIMSKAESLEKGADRLLEYCDFNMRMLDIDDVKADTFTAKFRKLPDMVDVVDNGKVPKKYQLPPAEPRPDKKMILAALKAGKKFAWAVLVKDRKKLEFK